LVNEDDRVEFVDLSTHESGSVSNDCSKFESVCQIFRLSTENVPFHVETEFLTTYIASDSYTVTEVCSVTPPL